MSGKDIFYVFLYACKASYNSVIKSAGLILQAMEQNKKTESTREHEHASRLSLAERKKIFTLFSSEKPKNNAEPKMN